MLGGGAYPSHKSSNSSGRVAGVAHVVPSQTYAELEARAVAYAAQVERDPPGAGNELRYFEAAVERMLWRLWDTSPRTAGYWEDGVLLDSVERSGSQALCFDGRLWCADHRAQWLVPMQVVFELGGVPVVLRRIYLRIGNGARDSLRDHDGRRSFHRPETWLCEFVVAPPAEETIDVAPVLTELAAWLEKNAQGKLVGPDWQPFETEEAVAFIEAEGRAQRQTALEHTWLDGGPAIRLVQDPSRANTE